MLLKRYGLAQLLYKAWDTVKLLLALYSRHRQAARMAPRQVYCTVSRYRYLIIAQGYEQVSRPTWGLHSRFKGLRITSNVGELRKGIRASLQFHTVGWPDRETLVSLD